jgi:hypothetical protein
VVSIFLVSRLQTHFAAAQSTRRPDATFGEIQRQIDQLQAEWDKIHQPHLENTDRLLGKLHDAVKLGTNGTLSPFFGREEGAVLQEFSGPSKVRGYR